MTVTADKQPVCGASVNGGLRQHIEFWEIEAPKFMLDTICDGYELLMRIWPAYSFMQNIRSAHLHSQFFVAAILVMNYWRGIESLK